MPTAGSWKVPFKGKFSPYDTEGNRMVPAFSISSRQRNTTVNNQGFLISYIKMSNIISDYLPARPLSSTCPIEAQDILRSLHLLPARPTSRDPLLTQPFVNLMTGQPASPLTQYCTIRIILAKQCSMHIAISLCTRGDFPIALKHDGRGNRISWKVKLSPVSRKLNFAKISKTLNFFFRCLLSPWTTTTTFPSSLTD